MYPWYNSGVGTRKAEGGGLNSIISVFVAIGGLFMIIKLNATPFKIECNITTMCSSSEEIEICYLMICLDVDLVCNCGSSPT
jgi:hypothetical protein